MQPRVTVALATVWLTVAVLVGGAVTLRLSHDQYSPASPRRHAGVQQDHARDWRDRDPAEDQPFDLWIGSRRPIFTEGWQRRLSNIAGAEFATDKVDYGYEMPETLSSETVVSPSDLLDDPFVADDTFQDQGPGSMEIYKLDLSKEKTLLTATTPSTNLLSRNKSKAPKKTGHLNSKTKTTEVKSTTTSENINHRQSNFFEEQRTETSLVNRDAFGVGGVPELQVGCEGLEASSSSHKAKRSIDTPDEEKGEMPASVLLDVMPVSLDLDDDALSYDEEEYEEMDELFKLKKLETTTKNNKPNRGDMDASYLNSDHLDEFRQPEKLPVRGDLGKYTSMNSSGSITDQKELVKRSLTDLEIESYEKIKPKREAVSLDDDDGAGRSHGRRLLWFAEANAERFADGKSERKRTGRSIDWGYGEDEGVVSSDELQTVNERRRQHDMRYHQDMSKRHDQHHGLNTNADSIRREYEKLLEQKRRDEEEHLRQMQQANQRTLSRWEEEEKRRRDEMRRRHYEDYRKRMNHTSTPRIDNEEEMEERQRLETAYDRTQEIARKNEEELRRRQEEEERRRRLQEEEMRRRPQNKWQEEENWRKSGSRTSSVSDEERRRRLHEEEMKRREEEHRRRLEEEQRRQLQEEEMRRRPQNKWQEEENWRKSGSRTSSVNDEERRRKLHEEEMKRREEEHRRRLEEEQRRQLQEEEMRRRPQSKWQEEENLRKSGSRTSSVSDEERRRRLYDQEMKRREEEHRRRLEEEEEARRQEQYRSQQEAQRKKEEEERRRQENSMRNLSEYDRRRLEDRRREWSERRKQENEDERRQQQPPSNLMRAEHPVSHSNDIRQRDQDERRREQEERVLDQKLREYVARNQPINVNRINANRRPEEERRRYRPEENRDPRINVSRDDEEYRRRVEEQRKRQEEERRQQDYIRRYQSVNMPSRDNQSTAAGRNWFEERRLIEEARRRDRYPDPGVRRDHGPSAPTYIDPRSSPEEVRRRQQETARRLEEERRQRYEAEEQRKELARRQWEEEKERRLRVERMRKEAARREEEARRAQSRKYEEDRKRLEVARIEAERRRQEMLKERSRNEAGRTKQPEATRQIYHQDPSLLEHRRRQDSRLIPNNLMRAEEARRAAAERERQRLDAERRQQEESRMREHRQKETDQWSRQELARLNSLPVNARIIVRPGGSWPTTSPDSPVISGRFGNEIDFTGINPHREGVQVPQFPVPATSRPPVQTPSPCVWAVIHCCSSNNNRLVKCFESLGCPGINWDPNPCRGAIADAARAEVLKFYQANNAHN
ncbi:trichohyalin isoform X2 [Solenopsis invicta]|nr:trichohyalin isoform X2 [Solenopsis invicta]XP_025989185.2 trichohyalin isoform X2 [Solenopsis invicta]XP_039312194.1 trichohyalin isoform X2 [Solenopsis invicta]XP_039312195.1 trichohyalin isoform X2 [Solenopsis invicta]